VITAAVVATAILLFAPLLAHIPKPALAGLLLVTAARLVDFKRLFFTLRATRYDAGLVLVTAFTAVLVDLDTAVLLGVALSILLFVPRAAKLKGAELIVTPERVVRERLPLDAAVDPGLLIYDLEGELFFGAAPELDRYFGALKSGIEAQDVKFLVLRLKRVRNPDVVCIERLEHFLREETAHGVTVLLAGVRPDTAAIFANISLESWFPASQVFPEEEQQYSSTLKAVRFALAKLRAARADEPIPQEQSEVELSPKLYYLV
jgi:SulP family sulfate permease